MSLYKFYSDAKMAARNNGWRYGQAMFNHLMVVRPDLAEKIRGTDMDPFCVGEHHPNWDRFVKFIETNWNYTPKQYDSNDDWGINNNR